MSAAERGARISEVLASFRESLGVVRARCYTMEAGGGYRLAASFGFSPRFGPEDVLEPANPLVEWVQRHRKPIYANSPQEAGELARVMERGNYARALLAPLYQGGRLVGIVELQDKVGGTFFGYDDLSRVERMVSQLDEVLKGDDNLAVAKDPMPAEDQEALFVEPPEPSPARFPPPPPLFRTPEAQPPVVRPVPKPSVGERPAREQSSELSRREILIFKAFGNALLLDPEIEAIVFSHWGAERAELYVEARHPFSEPGREALLHNLESALLSALPGVPAARERRFHMEFPVGHAPGEIREFAGSQTSVVFSGKSALLFTLVFARPPAATTEDALTETHRLIRATILQVRGAERYYRAYRSFVSAFLEGGSKSYPRLKAHSLAVAGWSRRMAMALRLSADTIEEFTVAGLLHDIGLRELEIPYERLQESRPLDLPDLAIVRQHAVIGAEILGRIDFPYSVAPLVRHHHERFDGGGYPDRLSGSRIPLGARIIGIAEAYDAMTSPHSYRSTVSSEAALEIILVKSGTQFDPELAKRFCELVRSSPATSEAEGAFPGLSA
ncbi:MAG TPA: HD domain-containing phosphohydrolase [Thermoanaerobaculia bacterium]|nr:HD domain-containing phosphohydrolase [Thermoanaerobaculia bacterium]